jgi:aryl-alcohol dehydrogenase-like predicted oxidoreductase
MNTRKAGKDGPNLTEMGIGTGKFIGPEFNTSWNDDSDSNAISVLKKALDSGINWIDTAAVYGNGHAEKLVGWAIKEKNPDESMVLTKCGSKRDGNHWFKDLRPQSMREELENSLRNINRDYIDIYLIHWPDFETGTPLEESWQQMIKFREEGKVRYIGVSNFELELIERCEKIEHIQVIEQHYNMAYRSCGKTILKWGKDHDTGIITYSPLQRGLITGLFDTSNLKPEDYWKVEFAKSVNKLKPFADKYNKSIAQLAVAWILANDAVTSVISGATRPSRLEESLDSTFDIEPEDINAINSILNTLPER